MSRRPRQGPDFLCIGAPRCGTTWLYQMLKTHPQIWLPPVKELKYFHSDPAAGTLLGQRLFGRAPEHQVWRKHLRSRLEETVLAPALFGSGGMVTWWRKGAMRLGDGYWGGRLNTLRRSPGRFFSDLAWDVRYFGGEGSEAWYCALFDAARERVTGDITPSYLMLDAAQVARAHRLLPQAKIVLFLRDPIERFWAAARMQWGLGKLSFDLTDAEAIARLARHPNQVLRADYQRALTIWEARYPPAQWFIAFYEELAEAPEALLMRLYRFLGVEASARRIPAQVRQRVLAAPPHEMPPAVGRELARQYLPQLEYVQARFGGYTTRWLHDAQARLA